MSIAAARTVRRSNRRIHISSSRRVTEWLHRWRYLYPRPCVPIFPIRRPVIAGCRLPCCLFSIADRKDHRHGQRCHRRSNFKSECPSDRSLIASHESLPHIPINSAKFLRYISSSSLGIYCFKLKLLNLEIDLSLFTPTSSTSTNTSRKVETEKN